MAKCENCYHKKICIDGVNHKYAEKCRQFKDEVLIVELPCKVGDVLYSIRTFKSTGYETVYSFTAPDIIWIIAHINDIGEDVFLTKEEAEKTLSGRKA